jgi:tripartite ATP-independent transporter DctM subunit
LLTTLVVAFVFFALIGMPIAISLGIASALALAFSPFPTVAAVQKWLTGIDSYTLLAIPLFILAGQLMNVGGVTYRIFNFAQALVGHIPGGLAHANIVASIIFAGMSGSAVADAAGLGLVEMEAMTSHGYDERFSAAVTAASSVIGPIIPPSIPMLLYASIAEESVGKLFLGGIIPGLMMGISMMLLVYFLALKRGYPKEERVRLRQLAAIFIDTLPALLSPVIIIGGMLTGIFTATEAAAVTVGYAFVLSAFVYRELKLKDVPAMLLDTVYSTAVVTFILSAAAAAGWILVRSRAGHAMADFVLSVTSNRYVVLLLLNILLLLLGCVMELGAIMILTVPVLIPLLQNLGIDLVHFGVVMTVNLMIGFITPPFGMSLFVLSGVTGLKVEEIVKDTMPFLIPLIITLLLITYIPGLVMAIPNWLMP